MLGTERAGLWLAAACVAAFGIASGAVAGEAEGDREATLPPVVVTATRVAQPVEQVGSAVTVIHGEALRRRGIEFVEEALREVPGVTTITSGGRGKTTSLFVRGANSDQTLVLVDGVRINDPVGGAVDLGALRTDNVERIEIVRGPQSTLYGSDAMGGVVNIITRRAARGVAGSATGLAGNYHTYSLAGSLRAASDRFGLSAEASRFSTDNARAADDFDVDTLSTRADAGWTDRLSSTLTFRRSVADTGVPGSTFFTPTPGDRQENRLAVLGLGTEWETTAAWRQRLTLGVTDQSQRSRGSVPSDSESLVRMVEWVHTVVASEWLSLVLGGEYRVEDGEFTDLFGADIDASLYTRAAFAQAQVTAFAERLFLQVGARLDDGTRIDSEVSPRVAGAVRLEETGTRLHASAGKGIKSPTLLDLYAPGFFGLFAGNPNLEPERSTGWDVGVDQRWLDGRLEAGATFFRNDFEDLVAAAETTPFPLENVGQAHSYGVESTLAVRPAAWIEGAASYTYLEARNDDTNTQLLRRPRNQASATVTVRPAASSSASLTGLYVGRRRDFLQADAGYVGGYLRVDASATHRLGRVGGARGATIELLGRVENLLDREYQEVAGFPALGINFLAGLRGTF